MPVTVFRAYRTRNGEVMIPDGTLVRMQDGRPIGTVVGIDPGVDDGSRTVAVSFVSLESVPGFVRSDHVHTIPNAPTSPPGYVASWDGANWVWVPVSSTVDITIEEETPSKSALERILDDEDLL